MLAYDYPLLSVFWSILMFGLLVLWIFIVIWAFIDNFRRTDHHGVAKALWFLFIVFVPVIGVFSYILTRPVDPYVVVTTFSDVSSAACCRCVVVRASTESTHDSQSRRETWRRQTVSSSTSARIRARSSPETTTRS